MHCCNTRPWRYKVSANSFTLTEVSGVTRCTMRLLRRIHKCVQGHLFHIGCSPWASENTNVYQCGGFLKPSRSLTPRVSNKVAIFFRKLRFVRSFFTRRLINLQLMGHCRTRKVLTAGSWQRWRSTSVAQSEDGMHRNTSGSFDHYFRAYILTDPRSVTVGYIPPLQFLLQVQNL